MITQGMEPAKKGCKKKKTLPFRKRSGEGATASASLSPDSPESESRSELMRLVRQKIQSGYYNSESVLDDLSHGFASALNSM